MKWPKSEVPLRRSHFVPLALCGHFSHITQVIAVWWKNAGNNLVFECQSICTPRSYKKHKVSSMSNNYVYRIPFRSCLKHCLTVEMVKVQNGFPDHKDSNRLWLLSSPGFWQSYIYQEPKDDLFLKVNPPKEGTPKLQSKPRGSDSSHVGEPRLSLHRFVWSFPTPKPTWTP